MHIGHSIYQDDFNKLHFLKKYKPKLIDIIFNDKQSLTTNFKMIKLPIQNNLLIERLLDQNDWNNQFENILNCFYVKLSTIRLEILFRIRLKAFLKQKLTKSNLDCLYSFYSQPILMDPYPFCFIE